MSGSEDDDSSDDEDEFEGKWDDRCRVICHDMRTKKALGDKFASERIQELAKKNSKCEFAFATLA